MVMYDVVQVCAEYGVCNRISDTTKYPAVLSEMILLSFLVGNSIDSLLFHFINRVQM
jgi:hypothetical protein